jgi:hypothetical protein
MKEVVLFLLTGLAYLLQWGPAVALVVWFGWRAWRHRQGDYFLPGSDR